MDVSEFVQANICGGDAKFALFDKFDDRYCAKCGPFSFVEINVNENERVCLRMISDIMIIKLFKAENLTNMIVGLFSNIFVSSDHVKIRFASSVKVLHIIVMKDSILIKIAI